MNLKKKIIETIRNWLHENDTNQQKHIPNAQGIFKNLRIVLKNFSFEIHFLNSGPT